MRAWLGVILASMASAAGAQGLTNHDGRAPAEPFAETVHGIAVDDPWRWMERADRAQDVRAFVQAASAHTVAQLAALPGRARLRDRIDRAMQAGVRYTDARQSGPLTFYRRMDPGAQLAKLVVRGADGAERVLYDPEAGGARGPAINSYSVSPDGRTVALHSAAGGAEVGAVRFIETATGRELPDRLEPVWGEFEVNWLDGRTFAYTRMNPGGSGVDALQNMRAYLRRLGGPDGAQLLGSGAAEAPQFPPEDFPIVTPSEASANWVIGWSVGARADVRILVARRRDVLAGRPQWRQIADLQDHVRRAALIGDSLYLVTTKDAPNGKVVVLDLARGGTIADARTVVPESDAVLDTVLGTPGMLYVIGQTDGLSRLFAMPPGGPAREIALPMQGLLAGAGPVTGGDGITFSMVDWFTAPRWFRARGTRVEPLGLDSASHQGVAGARQLRETAVSADGTRVPMAILLPPNRGEGPLPLLLEGYGSYGINTAEPFYAQQMFALLEEGAAVAFCGTRGGGERGRSWHEGGRHANKPNAIADLIACGERLVEIGLTSPARMTLMGTSAGGLLAPPAALARPDLFRALVANVAILNPSRLEAAENGANQYAEMGDPRTADGLRALMRQDAYHLLREARDTPDTLLTVGLNDRRVEPWMSAKYAARALQLFGDRRLVLMRTDPEAGHGIGSARSQLVEQYADVWAFVLNRGGAEGFTPR